MQLIVGVQIVLALVQRVNLKNTKTHNSYQNGIGPDFVQFEEVMMIVPANTLNT